MPTERRLSFGEVAELYDRVRPSYPAELVDDVLSFSRAAAGDRALEVGAGTGRATALFAAGGLEILGLEPSSGMAGVASRTCAQYENVRIEQSEFERWRSDRRGFELLFSAQAWHWIPRELRYAKAREVLAPSGVLAVFWNRLSWDSSPLSDELAAIYRRRATAAPPPAGPPPPPPPSPRAPAPRCA